MVVTTKVALDPEKECEIVAGQPEEKEMRGAGGVWVRLIAELWMHVKTHKLGSVYGPYTTFQIGQNQRLLDVSFVAAACIPADGEPEGIWPIAPDLAVEIISPNDLYERVSSKVREYFVAGVQQVWLLSPEHKTVTIYHSLTRATILLEENELVSADPFPGFRCRINELFQHPAHT
jgi:Uma2 family endonuclease